jgi:hypothetical protein
MVLGDDLPLVYSPGASLEALTLTLQKSEGFRTPGDGISTSLQQGVKGEIVVGYLDPLTTQDLKSSGFPRVFRVNNMAISTSSLEFTI